MLFESARIINQISLLNVRVPVAGVAKLDFAQKQVQFLPGDLEQRRGLIQVEAVLADGARSLEWLLDETGIEQVRESSVRHASTAFATPKAGGKWGWFEKQLQELSDWRSLLRIVETACTQQRTKGSLKDQDRIVENLCKGISERFNKLVLAIGARREGIEFVRGLLRSGDDEAVRAGLLLVPEQLFGAVQEDLLAVLEEGRGSASLRRYVSSMIYPELRGAVNPATGSMGGMSPWWLAKPVSGPGKAGTKHNPGREENT
jgi:hypothetical protein